MKTNENRIVVLTHACSPEWDALADIRGRIGPDRAECPETLADCAHIFCLAESAEWGTVARSAADSRAAARAVKAARRYETQAWKAQCGDNRTLAAAGRLVRMGRAGVAV